MKKLFFFLIAMGLFYFGCTDVGTNNINQPATADKQVIQLPESAGLATESNLSVSDLVNGDQGDVLSLAGKYQNKAGDNILTIATLIIPRGAFDGKKNITMSVDQKYAGLDFSPSMIFEKSLSLTLSFTGLDLKSMGITNTNVGFYYVDDAGNLTPIQNLGVSVNFRVGSITVVGAKIDHFSRYAFAH
jgi:hypothetical protein